MTENSHIVIIPDSGGCGHGSSTETLRYTAEKMPVPAVLVNVAILYTCEASENGIPCWHHADVDYITSENITRHLCKQCYNKLWKIVRASLQARVQNRLCDEKGRVA